MRIHLDIDTDGLDPESARALARLVLTTAGVPVETVTVDNGDIRHFMAFEHPPAQPFEAPRDPAAVFAPPSVKSDADQPNHGHDAGDDDASAAYEAEGGTLPTVDKHGVPWDKRIHSTPASYSEKSGEWRRKRGVQETVVSAVIQELTAAGLIQRPQAHAPTVTPTAPPAPPPPVTSDSAPPAPPATPSLSAYSPTPPDAPSPPAEAETPPAPVAPVEPAPPPVLADTPQMRFGRVMKRITAAQTSGKMAATRPTEIAASLGLASVASLFSTGADQMDAFEAIIDSELA